MDEVSKTLKAWDQNQIQGPFNPTTNYECGLLVEGFDDPPQIMMTFQPKFLSLNLEKLGYTKAKDLLAYQMSTRIEFPEIFRKVAKRTEKSARISYRTLKKKDWDNEVQRMLDIYNEAWEKNWGFIPMEREEFIHIANDLKLVADENLILFAEVDKEPIAFLVMLPDFHQIFKQIPNGKLLPTGIFKLLFKAKEITRARILTLGIKEKYRGLGIDSLLYLKIQEHVNQARPNLEEVEMSWILEDNVPMNKPLVKMGAKVYKKYRIYEKTIS